MVTTPYRQGNSAKYDDSGNKQLYRDAFRDKEDAADPGE